MRILFLYLGLLAALLACGCALILNTDCSEDLDICPVGYECVDGRCQSGSDETEDIDECADGDCCDTVVECNDDDGCCPEGCSFGGDNDCCESADQCDDDNMCTVEDCVNSLCTYINLPAGTDCEGTYFCRDDEVCGDNNGVCDATSSTGRCDDGFECTDDLCDEANEACSNLPNHATCESIDSSRPWCNPTHENADENGCRRPEPCPDGDADCRDEFVCNGEEYCAPDGYCRPGNPLECADGATCTEDTCDATIANGDGTFGACRFDPIVGACEDGSFCTVNSCEPGSPYADASTGCVDTALVCNDDHSCTTDLCNETTDRCESIPNHDACNDFDSCTTNTCDPDDPMHNGDGCIFAEPACDEISDGCCPRFCPVSVDPDCCVVSNCGDWVSLSAGTYTMGSPAGDEERSHNESQHVVTLTRDYEIRTTEVTQSQFRTVMGYNESIREGCGNCPVETVSWHEAAAYCNALSDLSGLDRCYSCSGSLTTVVCEPVGTFRSPYDCLGYRLPMEAEWEHAARSGTTGSRYGEVDEVAWHYYNSGGRPQWVATKAVSPWGLYDMLGNVYEWCHDWYVDDLGSVAVTDPWGPILGERRALRGGSWDDEASYSRAPDRIRFTPDVRSSLHGFRPVRTLGR